MAAFVCWWLGLLLLVLVTGVIQTAAHRVGWQHAHRISGRVFRRVSVFLIPYIIFTWCVLMSLLAIKG